MKLNFIINYLKTNNLNLSVCESITGGKLGSVFVKKKNASKIFFGGFITYQNIAKLKILKLQEYNLQKFGVVSKEFSEIMAVNTKQILDTNIVIALTGNAGPKCLENKAKGLVYVTILINKKIFRKKFIFNSFFSRKKIINLTVKKTIKYFFDILKKN